MAALKYWVWLTTLPGLTNRSKLLLLEHFPSPEDIYYAQPEDLPPVEGLSSSQAALLSDKSTDRAEDVLARCAKGDIFLLTMQDALYPDRLRNIYDPPVLLYGRGRMPLFDEEAAVSVVGTRTCTPYGISAAEELGYQLAKEGAVVVSGLARGIDGAQRRSHHRQYGAGAGTGRVRRPRPHQRPQQPGQQPPHPGRRRTCDLRLGHSGGVPEPVPPPAAPLVGESSSGAGAGQSPRSKGGGIVHGEAGEEGNSPRPAGTGPDGRYGGSDGRSDPHPTGADHRCPSAHR